MARVYLSLGSNIEPRRHLAAALDELRARFGAIDVSPVYRTKAVGFEGEDFLNLAVGLDTDLEPVPLNDWLHALEARHGRRRDGPRFSSRTLDVDIVLYDDRVERGPATSRSRVASSSSTRSCCSRWPISRPMLGIRYREKPWLNCGAHFPVTAARFAKPITFCRGNS